jgi:hypothetical protein
MPILKNIQSKPPREKRKMLWILVGSSAVIIFILWIVVFPKDYLEKKDDQKSFGELREEFENSEENKQFDEYMNSLEIFEQFDENLDFEDIINEAQNTEYNTDPYMQNVSDGEPRQKLRLPLEKDEN